MITLRFTALRLDGHIDERDKGLQAGQDQLGAARQSEEKRGLPMDHSDLLTDLSSARELMAQQGVAFLPGHAILGVDGLSSAFAQFLPEWQELPVDPYFLGSTPTRFRRHAQFDFDADSNSLAWRQINGYFQPIEFNPVFGGMVRHFAPFEPTPARDLMARSLISLAAKRVFGLSGQWFINMHLVRVVSEPGIEAWPAPEGPHRDGYEFIEIHFVEKDNEIGGRNRILNDEHEELASLTLQDPLDTLYMDDRRYVHDVTPIVTNGRPSHRDMILMSYERPWNRRTGP
jgi:hypothetical protein